ncbi:ribosome maturation factor RimM [Bacteroidia bacterium]|nr:ribosome maturation factor RimM [Bacteroidia bacterium]
MIKREDIVKIGRFNKPHGIKGEISFGFTNDSFEDSDNPFLICELDGILVPFRLEEYRFTSDSAALVKLKNMDSNKKARLLANKDVYFDKKQCRDKARLAPTDTTTWDYFIGFTLMDEKLGEIGLISAVDDSTLNTLFIIEQNNTVKARHALPLLIPAADEMITHIDEEQKKIYVELPEGLLTL